MKKLKSFRLNALTEQILEDLSDQYHCSQADIIAECVYLVRELLMSPENLVEIRAKYMIKDFGKKW